MSTKIHRLTKPHGNANFYINQNLNGKRRRKFFKTEADAKKFLTEQKADFARFGQIYARMTIEEVKDYWEAKKLAGPVPLVEFVLSALKANTTTSIMTLGQAINQYAENKRAAGLDEKHISWQMGYLNALKKQFGDFDKITPEPLLKWLLSRGKPKTVSHYKTEIKAFFETARRRGWINSSPFDKFSISDFPKNRKTKKEIFTPEETQSFFSWLAIKCPELIPFYAIQAFAGIREAEAERIKWSDFIFDKKQILIRAEICKTGDDWLMQDLPDNLFKILSSYKKYTIAKKDNLGSEIRKNSPVQWRHNVLRHSFCTYHLSLYGDSSKTSLLLRHTNPRQLYQSYLGGLVDKDTAKKYFSVLP